MDSSRIGERRMQVPFSTITCVRLLEAMLCDVNDVTRLDIIKTMTRDEVAETLTRLLHDFVLFRHAMWQMGEPLVSSDVRRFLRFALPALRIIAIIYRQGSECIGRKLKMSKSIRVRMSEHQKSEFNDGHAKLVDTEVKASSFFIKFTCYIDTTLVDTLFLLWSMTGGMNGQRISEEGSRLRQSVFEVIHPVLYGPGKSVLPVILDRILDKGCQRPQLYPAVLSFIFAVAPSPSVILSDELLWKSELIKYRRKVKIFASSFLRCKGRTELCDVLLCTSSYVSQISRAFLEKLCKLHSVLAKDIVGSLIRRASASLVSYSHNPISKELVEAISDDDEEKEKKKEKVAFLIVPPTLICCEGAERASSGHVRMIESLLDLCQTDVARIIIPYYFVYDKSALEVVSRYLFVFEKAVADSERQKRFQQAVVVSYSYFSELLGPVCQAKYWEIQNPTENHELDQVIQHEINAHDLKEVKKEDNNLKTSIKLKDSQEQNIENHGDECSEGDIVSDNLKCTTTSSDEQSNEESEITYVAAHPLEAILLSFCRFISNCEHGLKLIRTVLIVLNEVADSESASCTVLRVCLLRIGIRRLLVRLDSSFGSDGVIETLYLVTTLLEKVFRGQAQELAFTVGYLPNGHTLLSLVELLKGQSEMNEISKSCLESLLRLGTALLEVESPNERSCRDAGKSGCRWERSLVSKLGMAESRSPVRSISAESFARHVVGHCHGGGLPLFD
uniref:DRIM domain-containing protein n=1 Tax=Heterorhabditis bacteriophora TaxID=37862 RepID=A0A1I7XCE0_HETBA